MSKRVKRSTTPMDKVVIILSIIAVVLIVVLIKMNRYYNELLKEYNDLQDSSVINENDIYDENGMYNRLLENTVSEKIVENKI
ncbi:MAG: hypothetical protein IKN74_05210 [Clostridia bacterium]|nr:hypothetical protein [Clostridia bacterium]